MKTVNRKIAFFLPSMRGGGAEKVAVSLLSGFIEKGYSVDLILVNAEGPFLKQLPKEVKLINLRKSRILFSVVPLAKYIRQEKYDALISFMSHANISLVVSSKLSRFKGKVILTEHNSLKKSLFESFSVKNQAMLFLMRVFYPMAHKVIAVSTALKHELQSWVKSTNIECIHNPIDIGFSDVLPEIPIPSWFSGKEPIVMGMGRFTKQKNFPLLIKSFKLVNDALPSRLIILGDGEDRKELNNLISELRLNDRIWLPGFIDNPKPFFIRASVFVLSSDWEGFGLAVAEAVAAGTTVVSTDCPVGPAEILANGKFGYLVPVGDEVQLAQNIVKGISNPKDKQSLQKRGLEFSIESITEQYIQSIFY